MKKEMDEYYYHPERFHDEGYCESDVAISSGLPIINNATSDTTTTSSNEHSRKWYPHQDRLRDAPLKYKIVVVTMVTVSVFTIVFVAVLLGISLRNSNIGQGKNEGILDSSSSSDGELIFGEDNIASISPSTMPVQLMISIFENKTLTKFSFEINENKTLLNETMLNLEPFTPIVMGASSINLDLPTKTPLVEKLVSENVSNAPPQLWNNISTEINFNNSTYLLNQSAYLKLFKPEPLRFLISSSREVSFEDNSASFLLHLGNWNTDYPLCPYESYEKFSLSVASKVDIPTFMSIGSHEINDCQDVTLAWYQWQQYFGQYDSNWKHDFIVEYQDDNYANFAFLTKRVLVMGLFVVEIKNDAWSNTWKAIFDLNQEWVRYHTTIARTPTEFEGVVIVSNFWNFIWGGEDLSIFIKTWMSRLKKEVLWVTATDGREEDELWRKIGIGQGALQEVEVDYKRDSFEWRLVSL